MEKEKEAFLGNYTGQRIVSSPTFPQFGDDSLLIEVQPKHHSQGDYYLLLKPLSAISDEDAIEVAYNFFTEQDTSTIQGKELADYVRQDLLDDEHGINHHLTIKSVDLLRSKGYALPWRGIPVPEQISKGWIKLVE